MPVKANLHRSTSARHSVHIGSHGQEFVAVRGEADRHRTDDGATPLEGHGAQVHDISFAGPAYQAPLKKNARVPKRAPDRHETTRRDVLGPSVWRVLVAKIRTTQNPVRAAA